MSLVTDMLCRPLESWTMDDIRVVRQVLEREGPNADSKGLYSVLFGNPNLESTEHTLIIVDILCSWSLYPEGFRFSLHILKQNPNVFDLEITKSILPYQSKQQMNRMKFFHNVFRENKGALYGKVGELITTKKEKIK